VKARAAPGLRPRRVRDALTVTRLVEAIPTFESESAALANFA